MVLLESTTRLQAALKTVSTGVLKNLKVYIIRCLFALDDRNLEFGNWTKINQEGAKPRCDVFDVQCRAGENVTYKFLHSQIYESEGGSPKNNPAPDVHIIVVDSVSMSQFFRSMPITTHYLRTEMDAVIFPYLNKVGLNSRPNAYGFLMGESFESDLICLFAGERAEALPPNPWGKENVHGRSAELCANALDRENFIIYDFQRRGYKTMVWLLSLFKSTFR
jgi:hypothetical protein